MRNLVEIELVPIDAGGTYVVDILVADKKVLTYRAGTGHEDVAVDRAAEAVGTALGNIIRDSLPEADRVIV